MTHIIGRHIVNDVLRFREHHTEVPRENHTYQRPHMQLPLMAQDFMDRDIIEVIKYPTR